MTASGDASAGSRRARLDPRRLLDLERPGAARACFLILLVCAIVTPQVPLPGDLPAVRLEQILLLLFLPSLIGYLRRHPEARQLGLLDAAFATIVLLSAISVIVAPILVPQLGRSYHDLFDILRPIEYWFLYRLARLVPAGGLTTRPLVVVIAAAAIVSGGLAIVQRFGPNAFNEAVTVLWTGATHNLDVVTRGGRTVGTIGNPNSFGIFCGLLVLALFALAAVWRSERRRWRWGLLAALGLAVAGGVLSQSRSAAGGTAVAGILAVGALGLVRRRGMRIDLVRPIAAVVVAGGLTALVLARAPATSGGGTIVQRFNVGGLTDDTSVVVRLARLHVAFARPDPTIRRQLACDTGSPAAIQPGHDPQPIAGPASAAPADPSVGAASRDAQRKRDVLAIADRLQAAYCATGHWPPNLSAVWPPATQPRDPSTGQPYAVTLGPNGYTVSAHLEVASDPEGPNYVLTSLPDFVLNPSFEAGAASWEPGPGTQLTIVQGGRFGAQAAQVSAGTTAQVHQYVLYAFNPGQAYTASVWARSATGQAGAAHIVAVAWYTDGRRIAPIGGATAQLPADGGWVPIQTTFRMPTDGQIWVIELFLEPDASAATDFDGVSLTSGSVAASFPAQREVDPAIVPSRSPAFWSSPVIGLGSLASFDLGAFDNEYVRVLVHFGILGLLAYLLLFGAAMREGLLTWWRRPDAGAGAMGLGLALATVAVLVFDVAAGVYFSYQLMAVYWLLAGAIAGTRAAGARLPAVEEPVAVGGA